MLGPLGVLFQLQGHDGDGSTGLKLHAAGSNPFKAKTTGIAENAERTILFASSIDVHFWLPLKADQQNG